MRGEEFSLFVRVLAARTSGADVDEGAGGAGEAADLGVELVELLNDAARGAD